MVQVRLSSVKFQKAEVLCYEMGSDGTGGKHLYLDKDTGKLKMNGREVFKFAVRIMGDASTRVVEKANLTSDDIDLFIPHQANIRIMESARERLGISKDKMSVSVNKYGNTSAASIPLSIDQELKMVNSKMMIQLFLSDSVAANLGRNDNKMGKIGG